MLWNLLAKLRLLFKKKTELWDTFVFFSHTDYTHYTATEKQRFLFVGYNTSLTELRNTSIMKKKQTN